MRLGIVYGDLMTGMVNTTLDDAEQRKLFSLGTHK